MSDSIFKGKSFRTHAVTTQGLSEQINQMKNMEKMNLSIGTIENVYTKSMTCDVVTSDGIINTNIPLLTDCGVIDDEIYGELKLPVKGTSVILGFIEGKESFPFILGTFVPYANKVFDSMQIPVNSSSKQFTKKLLEDGLDSKVFRRIFKSGTTIEIQENGTTIIELPCGSYIKLDNSGTFIIEDSKGNKIESSTSSITINNNLEVLQ